MKILVVDDNDVSLTLIQSTLSRAGYDVDTATDGEQALALIKRGGYRLVVSDWEMPCLDGPGLCRAVRAEELPGYVYIVLVTSHGSSQDAVEGLSAGADDFVAKPFHPSELIARVRAGERIVALETRDMTIFALAKLAESRDPETGAHLERVRSYCRILARDLAGRGPYQQEINDEFVHLIYLTSPLHDIGKVGIPDSVLLKPGRLSDQEFAIMKMHAEFGAQTLEAALRAYPGVKFLEMARDIAATHHERWNGSGYPKGLANDAIPLSGRIVAVADVYDALTSRRAYKAAFSHEVAKSMITADSGSHFDPAIVESFLRMEQQFIDVLLRYGEVHAVAA
ncbi:MAG: response regulator [Phycisphaeraceae bacterium]|nr:response regulator [Phycisphaeraceae bacterium]